MMLRIYLTNLGAYNRGKLIGKWLDLPMDEDELQKELQSILDEGLKDGVVDEEYFITDYETDIKGLKIDEFENVFVLNTLTEEIEKLSEDDKIILQALLITYSPDLKEALDFLRKGDYLVYWDVTNERKLGEYIVEEGLLGEIPEQLEYYLDYEAIGHDWCLNGVTILSELGLAIEIL